MQDIKIVFEAERHRSAAYDNDTVIGVCTYQTTASNWIINHTKVNPEYGGQGIARHLVETVIKQARRARVKIIPECSYAAYVMRDKEKYTDVLETDTQFQTQKEPV